VETLANEQICNESRHLQCLTLTNYYHNTMKRNNSETQQLFNLPKAAAGMVVLYLLLAFAGCPPPVKDQLHYKEGDLCLRIDSTNTECHPLEARVVAIGIEEGKFYLRPLKSPRPADTTGFGDYPFWLRGNADQMSFKTDLKNRNVIVSDKGSGRSKTLHIEEGQHLLASQFTTEYGATIGTSTLLEMLGMECDLAARIKAREQRLELVDHGGVAWDSIEAVIISVKPNDPRKGEWEASYIYLEPNLEPGIGTMAIGDPTGDGWEASRRLDSLYRPLFEEAQSRIPFGSIPFMPQTVSDSDRVMGLWSNPTITDHGAHWVLECSIPINNVSFWVNCKNQLIIRDGNDIAYVLEFNGCRIGLRAANPEVGLSPEFLEIYYDENSCSQPDIYLENNNYSCP
jgi:hypothetical protein